MSNWSDLPCPPPGDLPHPGIELVTLTSPALAGRFFTTSATWGKNVSLCVAFSVIALWASLVAQTIKNPPMRETRVQSLGWEDPWEEGMVTHSSVLTWRIRMDKGAWQAPWGCKESNTTEWLSTSQHYVLHYTFTLSIHKISVPEPHRHQNLWMLKSLI